MAEQFTIDSTLVDATNTQIILDDGANGTRLVSHDYPDPGQSYMGTSSADTEGSVRVQNQAQDRTVSAVARCYGTSMRTRVKQLQQKAGKLNREGGTVTRTLTDGTVIHFDVLSAKCVVPANWEFANRTDVMVSMEFVCRPFGYGAEVGPVSDDFSTDTIASGDWTYATGSTASGMAISAGTLTTSTTGNRLLLRTAGGYTYADLQAVVKIRTGASAASFVSRLLLKWVNSTNYLFVAIDNGGMRIGYDLAGVIANKASSAFVPAINTDYWLLGRVEGNLVTASYYTTDPALGGTAVATTTYTLGTAADGADTALGSGVAGSPGISPSGTDAVSLKFDDFRVYPNTFVESTNPCVVAVVTGVKGDVPALGRLVVTDVQGADQAVVRWGLGSRYYGGTSAPYAVFMEAESRLLYSGVAGTAVSGASGGTIVAGTATTSYQALCATTTSGTVYGAHIGTYRVRGRVYCPANAGTVSYALQWGVGDLRSFTLNDAALYDPLSAATFRDIDLGLVYLPKVAKGAQRWEGRVLASSTTVGDRVGVDALYLYPAGEGFGEASAASPYQQPTVFSGRDEFSQSAGTLGAKTAPVGGTWATSGATTDFSVSGAGSVTRATTSDSGSGRYAILGTTTFTDCVVQIDFVQAAHNARSGVVARYVDSSNYATATVTGGSLSVSKWIAGTETVLATATVPYPSIFTPRTLRLQIDAAGRFSVYVFPTGDSPGAAVLTGQNTVLATGGTLASGKVGIRDFSTVNSGTRVYENFLSFVPTFDAAVFANKQLEIRSDQAIRLDSAGTVWSPVSKYEGTYLKVPPAGAEARSARIMVKGHRNDPDSGADSAIDDLMVQFYYTPRWSTVPEP